MEQGWTIDELAARVAAALDGPAYPGAPNGRVRDVPDARAIRWYSTIGLVDRPSAMRGRTALYGPRHLLQLVAVKRRQAQGHRLADIQAELAGATDDTLRSIADLPATEPELLAGPAESDLAARPAEPGVTVERPAARHRFWTDRPPADHQTPDHEIAPPDGGRPAVSDTPDHAIAPPDGARRGVSGGLHGVHLNGLHLEGGAVLLLPNVPEPDDLPAILAAARPLLDALASRGLLPAKPKEL